MKNINLRLPEDVHAKLTSLAESEHRSLNNMVIALIEREAERRS